MYRFASAAVTTNPHTRIALAWGKSAGFGGQVDRWAGGMVMLVHGAYCGPGPSSPFQPHGGCCCCCRCRCCYYVPLCRCRCLLLLVLVLLVPLAGTCSKTEAPTEVQEVAYLALVYLPADLPAYQPSCQPYGAPRRLFAPWSHVMYAHFGMSVLSGRNARVLLSVCCPATLV